MKKIYIARGNDFPEKVFDRLKTGLLLGGDEVRYHRKDSYYVNKLLTDSDYVVFLLHSRGIGKGIYTQFLEVTAKNIPYKVFMIKNTLLSQNDEHTNNIEDMMSTVDYSTLGFMLEYTQ